MLQFTKGISKRKKIYKKSILNYGCLPLLALIEMFTKEEYYEECAIIWDILRNYGDKSQEMIWSASLDEKRQLLREPSKESFNNEENFAYLPCIVCKIYDQLQQAGIEK